MNEEQNQKANIGINPENNTLEKHKFSSSSIVAIITIIIIILAAIIILQPKKNSVEIDSNNSQEIDQATQDLQTTNTSDEITDIETDIQNTDIINLDQGL